MSVTTNNTSEEVSREAFESFVTQKIENMSKRVVDVIEAAVQQGTFDSEFASRIKTLCETTKAHLLERHEIGELNLIFFTLAILMPYYDTENDVFDIDKLISDTVAQYKSLVVMLEGSPFADKVNTEEFKDNQKLVQLYEEHKDSEVTRNVIGVIRPYLKMFCELSGGTRK